MRNKILAVAVLASSAASATDIVDKPPELYETPKVSNVQPYIPVPLESPYEN